MPPSSLAETDIVLLMQRIFAELPPESMEHAPPPDPEGLYDEGRELVEREQFEAALAPFLRLVVHDPFEFRFQFAYGLCLLQLGAVERALPHFAVANILDPDEAGCAFRLGECHAALEERDAAIAALRDAIQLAEALDEPSDVRRIAEKSLDQLNA